jgi:hypothetical protein
LLLTFEVVKLVLAGVDAGLYLPLVLLVWVGAHGGGLGWWVSYRDGGPPRPM